MVPWEINWHLKQFKGQYLFLFLFLFFFFLLLLLLLLLLLFYFIYIYFFNLINLFLYFGECFCLFRCLSVKLCVCLATNGYCASTLNLCGFTAIRRIIVLEPVCHWGGLWSLSVILKCLTWLSHCTCCRSKPHAWERSVEKWVCYVWVN